MLYWAVCYIEMRASGILYPIDKEIAFHGMFLVYKNKPSSDKNVGVHMLFMFTFLKEKRN